MQLASPNIAINVKHLDANIEPLPSATNQVVRFHLPGAVVVVGEGYGQSLKQEPAEIDVHVSVEEREDWEGACARAVDELGGEGFGDGGEELIALENV